MRPEDQARPHAPSPATADDRRAAARLPQDALVRCNVGTVCDLSRTGVRVRCKRLPSSSLLHLALSDGRRQVTLKAEVVWVNKLGFRKYELGMHFLGPTPDEIRIISQFAMYNRFNRTM